MSIRLTHNATAAAAYGNYLSGAATGTIGFYIRYDGVPSAAVGNFNFFSGPYNYYQFYSEYLAGNVRLTCILTLDDGSGNRQYPNATVVINPNTVYLIGATIAPGRQRLWSNALATTMGSYSMPIVSGVAGPQTIGDPTASSGFAFSARDPFEMAGYEFTAADWAALRDGTATIASLGGTATGRWHWDLSGTPGQTPQVGDAGLVETFGTGLPVNGLVPGSGTILYSDGMPWVPAATVAARVSSGGTAIYLQCSDLSGNWTPETAYVTEPTITCPSLNGGAPFSLADPRVVIFRDSQKRGMAYFLPPGWLLGPADVVTMSLPVGAFVTAAGLTAAFSGPIPSYVGRSAYGNNADELPRTLKWGIVVDPAGYQAYSGLAIEANYVPRADGPSGISGPGGWNIGGITSLSANPGRFAVGWTSEDHTWIDQTAVQTYPLGVWSVWWDDTGDYVNHPTYFKITNGVDAASERVDLRVNGTAGLGQVRYYTIAMPSDGSALSIYVEVYQDQLAPKYANLGVYQPGDSGPPVVGAQGAVMKARLPACGAVRWVDNNQSTFCMIGPEQFAPFPVFSYWGGGGYDQTVTMSKIRPLVPANSPYTYNHLFGETYSCTLGPSQALDAPAPGTQQQITIADASATPVLGGTGPIFPGQILTNGSEKIRVVSIDPTTGTLTTVIRGSAGTTPQTAAAGATLGVNYRKTMGSTLATYIGGSGLGQEFVEFVTNGRHPFWCGVLPIYGGTGWPALHFPSPPPDPDLVLAGGDYQGTIFLTPTGPNSLLGYWGYGGNRPNETIPADLSIPSATLRLIMPLPEGASAPYRAQCAVVEAIGGDHWLAVPPLATDDALDAMADTYLAHTRVGSIKYLELGNEPWNNGYMTTLYYPFMDFVYQGFNRGLPNVWTTLVAQTAHARSRFRKKFRAAGRENEIRAILNLQTANMDAAFYWGLPQAMDFCKNTLNPADSDAAIDVFTVAPYWSQAYLTSYLKFMVVRDMESCLDLLMFHLNCHSTPAAYTAPISGYVASLSPWNVFRGDYSGSNGLTTQAENWTTTNAAWCTANLPAGKVEVGIYEYGLSELTGINPFADTIQDAAGINSSATTLTVANGGQFQVGQYLMLDPATVADGDAEQAGCFWAARSEWVLVTAITGNVLTITRGQGNSTARAHAQGAGVITDWKERSRDLAYHPLARILETDYLAIAQRLGASVACYHSLEFAYAGVPGFATGVEQWGMYHGMQMLPGMGDGSDGKANNLACLARPGPGQKATNVNQDAHNVSTRGQALRDWNAAGPAPLARVPHGRNRWSAHLRA